MKKTIVSMMLATALFAGGSVFAQTTPDGTTGASAQKEAVQSKDCCKGDKKGDKKRGKGKKMKAKGPKFNPFDGIQLTDEQQQQLQVLQQGLGPVVLTPEQQAKIKENPNLTDAEKKQLKEEKKANKLEAKKNYLQGVKETLTPEQYVIFLENCYIYSPLKEGKAQTTKHNKKPMPGARDGKKDFKGPKEGKQPKVKTADA